MRVLFVVLYKVWGGGREARFASVPLKCSSCPFSFSPSFCLVQYSHVVLRSEESKQLLLWCIGIVVNTIKGSSYVSSASTQPEGKTHNRLVKQPTLTTLPDSPTSPAMENVTFTIGQRAQGLERRSGLATVPEESSSSLLHVAPVKPVTEGPSNKMEGSNSSPSKVPVTHTPSIVSMTSILTSSTGMDQSAPGSLSWKDKSPFSEEVVALGVVCLGTCTHRMPSIASEYLVSEIIPCIAR